MRCRAESEQRRLAAEVAVAKKESEVANARAADLASQIDSCHQRLAEVQALDASERTALMERHQSEVADLQSNHARSVAGMQTVHDQTHCQLAGALADCGKLRERVQVAESTAERHAQDLAAAERALQLREADLEVRR